MAAIEAAGKTSRAQVACTHGEHDGVNYDGTGVYADHCYTLRGVVRKAGKVYIQLRNPWGPIVSAVEPTEPPDDGVPDGLFDLEYSKFTTLYASVDIPRKRVGYRAVSPARPAPRWPGTRRFGGTRTTAKRQDM